MGSACSLTKHSSSTRFEAVFSNNSLRQGCSLLKTNINIRSAFVEFVKDGEWYEVVYGFERSIVETRKSDGSLWRQFGYNEVCRSGECSIAVSASGSRSNSLTPDLSEKSSAILRGNINDYASGRALCILSKDTELRSLLVCALYPIFLSSPRFARLNNPRSDSAQKLVSPDTSYDANAQHKSQRLQETLLHAAAAFDQAELSDYLAAQNSNFLLELKSAFQDLPVKIMVAEVNRAKKESCIVYTNVKPQDKNRTLLTEAEEGLLGQDLHVLFGNICSPGGAEAIQRAVFNGRLHKQTFLLANGSVKLLALCPIFGADGKVRYTVSVESAAIAEAAIDTQQCMDVFEGIEDMLALLPLLVRA